MALKSNQSEQMAKRLKQDLEKLAPELKVAADAAASLEIKDGQDVVARIALKRREFEGFNIIHELSSSAGQGFPEHECWLAMKEDTSLERCAKLVKAAAAVGASELKIVKTAEAPEAADLIEANVAVALPNDARLGSVGA